jgi:RNA polymerase sigma-70 factor (ECF subfamily)
MMQVSNGARMKSDIMLLAAARKMNEEALIAIFDLYNPALYNYAFRLCNDAVIADQIVGDVFAKLVDQLHSGQGPIVNLRSYLFEVAYHLFVDEVHFSYRSVPLEAVSLKYIDGYSTEGNAKKQMLLKTMLRAITNDLTDDQRHVIILRFLEGFSLKETAAIMGKTVGNVKVIQNRAITALRKALDYQVVETRAISFMIRSMARASVSYQPRRFMIENIQQRAVA